MVKTSIRVAKHIEKWVKSVNHQKSLTDYNAAKYLVSFLEDRGLYMEVPFRNKLILGHSLIDELGASTMINKNIPTLERKIFTQAHELGHHILDPDLLRNNSEIDILTEDPVVLNKEAEMRANAFAAHLLLPDDVLDASMVEHKTRREIKATQQISYETLGYRLSTYMNSIFKIPKDLTEFIVNEFMESDINSEINKNFYDFWKNAYTRKPIYSTESLSTINQEIAIKYCDYPTHMYRKLKKIQIQENENFYKTREERLLYSALAENYEIIDDFVYSYENNKDLPF
ncbi:TPA: ImmA/IrrE family metallo-endopeptidase [Enterococcus faecium]|uniref:ImmA/IrrE family metallo-endopeptidase n=1 Tax=Enterococcus faecium TaxID=1352 RepID=UPI000330ED14|nr:ImmA/IrrE family metallo-endopeptidase [Enterococcus faecium]EOL00985.1 hypothetical protein SIE_00494 [Enterococcus faecium EnGen0153]EOL63091.1 hypothetical protein UK3_02602 [Enterococcus faecium EnGen0305]QXJ65768.1 ImmA/IrrE family metallo-endopeptidase [Enterococcus faecium]